MATMCTYSFCCSSHCYNCTKKCIYAPPSGFSAEIEVLYACTFVYNGGNMFGVWDPSINGYIGRTIAWSGSTCCCVSYVNSFKRIESELGQCVRYPATCDNHPYFGNTRNFTCAYCVTGTGCSVVGCGISYSSAVLGQHNIMKNSPFFSNTHDSTATALTTVAGAYCNNICVTGPATMALSNKFKIPAGSCLVFAHSPRCNCSGNYRINFIAYEEEEG